MLQHVNPHVSFKKTSFLPTDMCSALGPSPAPSSLPNPRGRRKRQERRKIGPSSSSRPAPAAWEEMVSTAPQRPMMRFRPSNGIVGDLIQRFRSLEPYFPTCLMEIAGIPDFQTHPCVPWVHDAQPLGGCCGHSNKSWGRRLGVGVWTSTKQLVAVSCFIVEFLTFIVCNGCICMCFFCIATFSDPKILV